MKYTLQVNQIAAHGIGIQDKIDLIDLCLFDAFKSFANSAKCEKMIDDNGIWFWISYAEIIRELPLANIKTKDGIYRRMLKLRDAGLIIFHPNNQKVTKTFFQWGKNYDAMERTDWEEQPKDKKPKVVKDLRMKNRSTYGQETVAPTDEKPYNQTTINQTTKTKGERTPPAPNPLNLQSKKNESGLVSPPGFGNFDHFSGFGLDYLKTPETVKAETPPLPKVAPKGIPPVRLDAKEIRGLVDLTETYPFGFCETCQGQKVVGGRNGLIECPTCEGTGLGNGRTESENPPPAQFEVTAIASPTELPGVTLVEAAPIHHRRNGRIEIPDEAAAEILPWAKGDGEQTVKSWYDRAFRQHSPKDVEDMVMRFSTVFLSSEKAAFRDMMETNPLSFFKRRFAGFVADQKQYDRNNAPKEGGATRQNGQPHSALPRSLQNQVGK